MILKTDFGSVYKQAKSIAAWPFQHRSQDSKSETVEGFIHSGGKVSLGTVERWLSPFNGLW